MMGNGDSVAINWQLIGFLSMGVVQLISLVGAYYGLKADNAKLRADVQVTVLTEQTARKLESATMRSDLMTLVRAAEQSVTDLMRRVGSLESGQEGWTKELRERAHELSEKVGILVLKVDRLERPHQS